jgi:hypothetical protein
VRSNGLPVPTIETLNEAKDFIENLHQGWEAAGGELEMTIGALVALGATTGIDEGILAVLGEIAAVTVAAYISACVGCLAVADIDTLRDLFASNPPQQFMLEQLALNGIDVGQQGNAVV